MSDMPKTGATKVTAQMWCEACRAFHEHTPDLQTALAQVTAQREVLIKASTDFSCAASGARSNFRPGCGEAMDWYERFDSALASLNAAIAAAEVEK